MNEQEQAKAAADTSPRPSPHSANAEREKSDQGSTEFRPTKEDCTAASLAIADEILMRVAPEAAGIPDIRAAVLQVIERDKADVLGLLRELGEALDSNAELNTYTGEFCTLVNPDFFPRLQKALERHTGVRVLGNVVRG